MILKYDYLLLGCSLFHLYHASILLPLLHASWKVIYTLLSLYIYLSPPNMLFGGLQSTVFGSQPSRSRLAFNRESATDFSRPFEKRSDVM